VITAIAVAALIGVPMLILQRYVASTRGAAIALVAAWFVIVAVGLFALVRRRPALRGAVLGAFLTVLVGTVVVGYWTGFRDTEVDEDVATAARAAAPEERQRGLGPDPGNVGDEGGKASAAPIELARGEFAGADGHAGSGTATVIGQPDGSRVLTFTKFDVDPGAEVEVYLVPGDGSDVSDRIELGDLKGNVGDQQYEIPASADLGRYSTVVLWCTPFTVRIAVAMLDS
jgi:hypothetical protein